MRMRVVMIALAVGAGLATLQGATAEAQWDFLEPPGMWWYYGSVDGCATITHVPNPVTNPALLRCNMQLTRIETLCLNPSGNDVNPGEAATQVVVFSTIGPGNITDKNKGKANVCVGVDELSLGPEILCVNSNWIPQAALTTEFLATCTTEKCTGTDPDPCAQTVPKDTQRCLCTLPAEFSLENMPTPCPDPLVPDPALCTAYQCVAVDALGNPTGGLCQLQ